MLTVPLPPLEDAVRRLAAVPMPCLAMDRELQKYGIGAAKCAHQRCMDSRLATAWLDHPALRDQHEAAFASTLQMYRERANLNQKELANLGDAVAAYPAAEITKDARRRDALAT